jgi:hypothetical protein
MFRLAVLVALLFAAPPAALGQDAATLARHAPVLDYDARETSPFAAVDGATATAYGRATGPWLQCDDPDGFARRAHGCRSLTCARAGGCDTAENAIAGGLALLLLAACWRRWRPGRR